MSRPQGRATRGTTGANRLRRMDRWLVHRAARALRAADRPLVVDLGFGASPVTTLELAGRLRAVRPDVEVVGLEIDPSRVLAAGPLATGGVRFAVGGFELAGLRPTVVRAANVLRQYDEGEVAGAWDLLRRALPADGVLVEGTCDELGRLGAWVTLGAEGPQTLTLSCRPAALERPSQLAERLPKALIHRNVPGEPVHELLGALDRAWAASAPHAAFGPRARWAAAAHLARAAGVPVLDVRSRSRLGELTVPWAAVAPAGGAGGP